MKRRLRDLEQGSTFLYGAKKFVVLDKLNSGVLVLLEQSSKSVPFNSKNGSDDSPKNNYAHSTLREEIEGPWLESLIEHGAKREDMVEFTVDLSPTDMSDGYGVLSVLAAPLTLWQYGKYKDIIPLIEDGWWWLVTPRACPRLNAQDDHQTDVVWTVGTNGDYYDSYYDNTGGIRPALVLNSELKVSLDGEEEEETANDCDSGYLDLSKVDTQALIRETERRLSAQIRQVETKDTSCAMHSIYLSTVHIKPETDILLEKNAIKDVAYCQVPKGDYCIYLGSKVSTSPKSDIPYDLREVMAFAKGQGCQWLILGSNCPPIDELPQYGW